MSRGANSFTMGVDLRGLDQYLDQLGDAAEEAALPACAAVAKVYYDAARTFVPRSLKSHYFYGKSYKETGKRYGPYSPGNLQNAIYRVYSKDNSAPGKAVYHVSYNYLDAPYAHMVEFGTSHSAPHPFIRRAMNSQAVQKEALDAGEAVLMAAINKAAAA
jgi:HK97 gp10 family phage protein